MPAHNECVLWTVETPTGQRVVCYAVVGEVGLAVTVERGGDIVLGEMVSDMDAAGARAEVVRRTLLVAGLRGSEPAAGSR